MSILQSTQSLFKLSDPTARELTFLPENPDLSAIYMFKGLWEDMGRPEVITVTIEPGDKLNNE